MYVNQTTTYDAPNEALTSQQYRSIEGGAIIDSTKVPEIDGVQRLYKYDVIAEITSSGKHRLVGYTEVDSAGTGVTEVSVKDDGDTNLRGFISGDTITVGTNTGLTVQSVDYTNGTITVGTSIDVSVDDKVELEDGGQTAKYVLLDGVDLSTGDQVVGAIDMCRLNEARMPITIYDAIKTDLEPLIQFE